MSGPPESASPRGTVFLYGGGQRAGSPSSAFAAAAGGGAGAGAGAGGGGGAAAARFWVSSRSSAPRAAPPPLASPASPSRRVVRPSLPSPPPSSAGGASAAGADGDAFGSGSPPGSPPSSALSALRLVGEGGSAGVRERTLAAAAAGGGGRTWLAAGPEKAGEHSWFALSGETFPSRGLGYLKDRVKVPSPRGPCDLVNAEMFLSHDKIGNIAARQGSFLRAARRAGDGRFYLVVAYVTPTAPFVHIALYFALDEARLAALPPLARLWARFVARGPAGDAFRRERWKVIPRIAEGSWMVSSAVGTKPAMLAQKLTHTWVHGAADDAGTGAYLESDCDVASSTVALMLVGMIQTWAKSLVIDLGFAIEPQAADEFPEVVVGAVRLNRLDTTRPPLVRAEPEDFVLGTDGTHGAARAAAAAGDGGDGDGDGDGDDGGGGGGDATPASARTPAASPAATPTPAKKTRP
jgi:hypothetical protein